MHRKHGPSTANENHLWVKLLDVLIYPIGLIGAVSFIPQVLTVWINQDASGLSSITWTTMSLVALVWILYGITHKAGAIIVVKCCWFTMNTSMAIATFVF